MKIYSRVFITLLLSVCASSLSALDIQFDRSLIQGALLRGTTDADSIKVLGKHVVVDDKGQFVFGLGRDVGASLAVTLIGSGDVSVQKVFDVAQREYKTQSIKGVAKKYVSPPTEVTERIQKENASIRKARAVFTENYHYLQTFKWPAEGPVSGVYGSQRVFNGVPKRPHFGLDIAAPTGTPVIAPVAGTVTLVNNDMYYSGGTLIIDHGRGVSSTFIHLSKVHVKEGDKVEQGQLIADIGATGRVTGAHLDWRVNWFDQRLDPELLLPARD